MHKIVRLSLLGILALALSCSKAEPEEERLAKVEVTSELSTRTSLEGTSVVWSEGDRLVVFASGNST
jgi:hypothetical protein